jgi:hypothetical protein
MQEMNCQIKGCHKVAEVEISGVGLFNQPGWWRVCREHRRVFAAQRPLRKEKLSVKQQTKKIK